MIEAGDRVVVCLSGGKDFCHPARHPHESAPRRRLDVVSDTPSPSFSPCGPPDRRLGGLATGSGDKSGASGPQKTNE
jgi:hypothetical protein